MEHLKGMVVDTLKDEFKGFPESLNGMIYISGNSKEGFICEMQESEKNSISIEYEIKKAKEFINSTDWYVVRKYETGKEIPDDVANKRNKAREILSNGIH